MKRNVDGVAVCVVGLGYVGLPLAEAFAKSLKVIGFDINDDKVTKLNRSNNNRNLVFTDELRGITLDQLKQKLTDNAVLIDIRGVFDIKEVANSRIYYCRL